MNHIYFFIVFFYCLDLILKLLIMSETENTSSMTTMTIMVEPQSTIADHERERLELIELSSTTSESDENRTQEDTKITHDNTNDGSEEECVSVSGGEEECVSVSGGEEECVSGGEECSSDCEDGCRNGEGEGCTHSSDPSSESVPQHIPHINVESQTEPIPSSATPAIQPPPRHFLDDARHQLRKELESCRAMFDQVYTSRRAEKQAGLDELKRQMEARIEEGIAEFDRYFNAEVSALQEFVRSKKAALVHFEANERLKLERMQETRVQSTVRAMMQRVDEMREAFEGDAFFEG